MNLEREPEGVTIYRVPATRIAESMGKKIVANIVMLGAVGALGGVVSYESLKQSVLASIPPERRNSISPRSTRLSIWPGPFETALGKGLDRRRLVIERKRRIGMADLNGMRIGVYVCHCGKNIGGTVRCEEVADYARELPGVILAKDSLYTCSEPGQEQIKHDIREHGLNRVLLRHALQGFMSPLSGPHAKAPD